MIQHNKIVHLKIKDILCEAKSCEKMFSTKRDMKEHFLFHHASKTERKKHYKWCPRCGQGTIYWKAKNRDLKMCYTCYTFEYGVTPKEKLEYKFFEALKNNFEESSSSIWLPSYYGGKYIKDESIGRVCGTNAKDKIQPDKAFVVHLTNGRYRTIIIELDERSHRSYETSCETARLFKARDMLDCETVFIRVGLNYEYTAEELEERVKICSEELQRWLLDDDPYEELYIKEAPMKVAIKFIKYENEKSLKDVEKTKNVIVL